MLSLPGPRQGRAHHAGRVLSRSEDADHRARGLRRGARSRARRAGIFVRCGVRARRRTAIGAGGCSTGGCAPRGRRLRESSERAASIDSSNTVFNEVVRRSVSDLYMLITDTPQGPYPYAGIPWFSTPFGRDGLITALMTLWLDPDDRQGRARLSRRDAGDRGRAGARRRARQDIARDAPRRDGESARSAVRTILREHRRDAAVRAAARRVLPAHRRSATRCARSGRMPRRRSSGSIATATATATVSSNTTARRKEGLANQGWKDSYDAIFHRDGRTGGRSDRAVRGAGATCTVPSATPPCLREALGRRSAPRALAAQAEALRQAIRSAVLVRGTVDLRAGAGRREAALPGDLLERRPGALHRHRLRRACAARRAHAALAGRIQRLGHPHHRLVGGALQPDVLSQRLGLAARQRPDRHGIRPLRTAGGRGAGVRRAVRRRLLHGSAAPAGAVLRLRPPRAQRTHSVSGGLLSAGLGERDAAVPAAGLARPRAARPHRRDQSSIGRCFRISSITCTCAICA